MKTKDVIKAVAVSLTTGKIMATINDSGFSTLSDCKSVTLAKIPNSFEGKGVWIVIFNLTTGKVNTYKVLNANYRAGARETKPRKRQTGSTNVARDKMIKAKPVGKRVSKTGRTYNETRANRSDVDRRKRL